MTAPPKDIRQTSHPLERGTLLANRYRVLTQLGSGGMGSVYEVDDEHLNERIALKLLHEHLSVDQQFRAQLADEVRLARRVSHPNVCRVHDLGRHHDRLFVTMELISGRSMRSMIRHGETPQLSRKIDILIQLCSALAAAHRAGVLHRDVKPANVVVEADRAVLSDFGVASLAEDPRNQQTLVGTAAYMAPELLLGAKAEVRNDIYSTAILAFELFSGKPPFTITTVADALKFAESPQKYPDLPHNAAPTPLRRALDQVLSAALHPVRDQRPSSIDQFAEHLARAARGEITGSCLLNLNPISSSAAGTPVSIKDVNPDLEDTVDATFNLRKPLDRGQTDSAITYNRIRVVTALGFVGDQPISDILLERCVTDWGGHPVRAAAQGITALFGAPSARGDDAVRAARAGLDLLARFGGHAAIDTARFRFQLSPAGEVLDFDRTFSGLDTLFGDSGELGCSGSSARHIAGHFRAQPRGRDYRGRSRYAVTAANDIESKAEENGDRLFVGRATELSQLAELIRDSFRRRSPVVIELVGAAGIGKSELRRELSRRIGELREVEWLIGAATPTAETEPFGVLRSAAPSWYRAVITAAAASRENAFAAACAWLQRRAARRPIVFVLEDAHWADFASLEFARNVALGARGVAVVVLFVSRTPVGGGHVKTIQLDPLDSSDCAQLVRKLAPSLSLRRLRAAIARSGGNPLFLTELVDHWQDTENQSENQSDSHLPETVEAAIQGRLDRLDNESRLVLEVASLIGSEFSVATLGEILTNEILDDAYSAYKQIRAQTLDPRLYHLIDKGLLRNIGDYEAETLAFASELVRDAATAQLEPSLRMAIHRQLAERLESQSLSVSPASPAINIEIAHHWDAAGVVDKAMTAYREAGRAALKLFAYTEAAAALERAEILAGPFHRDADLLELVADALMQTDAEDAGERLTAALELTDVNDHSRRTRLLIKMATTSSRRADHNEAVRLLEQARLIATQYPEQISTAIHGQLYAQLGWVLGYKLGDNKRGLQYSEHAVALFEDSHDNRGLARALGRLGANYMRAGRWRDQLVCNQRNLKLAIELGDSRSAVVSQINLGVVCGLLGEFSAAIEHTCHALEISMRDGHPQVEPLIRSNLGGLLLESNELSAAKAQLSSAIELATVVGHESILPEAHGLFARLHRARGDHENAKHHAQLAIDFAHQSGSTIEIGIAKRHLAVILADAGKESQALDMLRQAKLDLENTDSFEFARTQVAEARLLKRKDSTREWRTAAELFDSARSVFESLGAKRDLEMLNADDDLR